MAFVDTFGDRMKAYEAVETARRLDARTSPIYARLDGRGFSKFTRGLRRPFDERMMCAMHETCSHLVAHTAAKIGYTQSDEISLVWNVEADNPLSQMFFDGKLQKLTSVLASRATAVFMKSVVASGDPEFAAYADRLPHFDARVFALPTKEEATNAFLWRCADAERNAISMVAQANFSHAALQGKSQTEMLRMCAEQGIDFEEFPDAFRYGQFFRREIIERTLGEDEIARMPSGHQRPADTIYFRRDVLPLEGLKSFRSVVNRVGVVFDGEPVNYLGVTPA